MSDPNEKMRNSTRRHRDEVAIKKQLKIAKKNTAAVPESSSMIKQPHRLAKRHAMDCGNSGCILCGNPRHLQKDSLTTQEKRFYQDMDSVRDRHSNGLPPSEDE